MQQKNIQWSTFPKLFEKVKFLDLNKTLINRNGINTVK